MYQIDLNSFTTTNYAFDPQVLPSWIKKIYSTGQSNSFGTHQVGPDGKIYVANPQITSGGYYRLSTITNTNDYPAIFNDDVVILGNNYVGYSLPQPTVVNCASALIPTNPKFVIIEAEIGRAHV